MCNIQVLKRFFLSNNSDDDENRCDSYLYVISRGVRESLRKFYLQQLYCEEETIHTVRWFKMIIDCIFFI